MYQSNITETVVDATDAIIQERTIVSQGDESSVEISQNSKG